MRGEDCSFHVRLSYEVGSPPHAWGRPLGQTRFRLPRRFTPTCVGKTVRETQTGEKVAVHPHMRGEDIGGYLYLSGLTVHPHMRGEDTTRHHRPVIVGGSPPHAWGRPQRWCFAAIILRFTPTCVGKTAVETAKGAIASVHPHMRGEDLNWEDSNGWRCGSPPHAWGRHRCGFHSVGDVRFTPTCVGKTCTLGLSLLLEAVHPHMRGEDSEPRRRARNAAGSPPHAWGRLFQW